MDMSTSSHVKRGVRPIVKRRLASLVLLSALFAWEDRAEAVPVACIACGSTAIAGPNVDGTISFAVISGANFLSEIAFHGIGFAGAVPGGSLDAVPNVTAPTDFVYLYQTVNDGQNATNISSYQVALGIPPALLTGGGRLESTLFVDTVVGGPVSPGPIGVTTSLSAGPTVDFLNGLGAGGFGACLGSGATAACSDATANLLPGAIQATNFAEAPSNPLLDPMWTSSIMWYSTPVGPRSGLASIFGGGTVGTGAVPIAALFEPDTINLFGAGLLALGLMAWRRRRQAV